MEYEFLYNNNTFSISLEKQKDCYIASVGDNRYEVDVLPLSSRVLSLKLGNRSILVHTAKDDRGRIVCVGGVPYLLADKTDDQQAGGGGGGGSGDGTISTPMPGKIVAVHVKEGDTVEKNQALLVVESMKMQNDILSDVNGVVKKIHFSPGEQAGFGEALVEIDLAEE